MEQYPSELTSPPVPLVALIGKPELHPALGDFLRSQNVPRVHSIGIPDAHSTAGTFGAQAMADAPAWRMAAACQYNSELPCDFIVAATQPVLRLRDWPAPPLNAVIVRITCHPPPFFCAGRRKGTPSGTTTAGILKAGWLRKHRTSTPAVAALLVDRASGGW